MLEVATSDIVPLQLHRFDVEGFRNVHGKDGAENTGIAFLRKVDLFGERIADTDYCAYQIIVADAADAVSVNFFGRCKFFWPV